ncbi:MAG: A/G-specific adenine glycosylase [Alphaproteobacteria bacterium]|nr:A/G-specific adenine glycosylase [Alphaproteobacteria bacterium]
MRHLSETDIAPLLLPWYDRHARRLPWRSLPGDLADPYHVWLSEVMLQQTTVATVGDYFRKFLRLWPTVTDLAEADLDDVLTAWAGLGYYARARNLHKCARQVAFDHKGQFPQTKAALLELPGIGRYTAAAIAAIAFNQPAAVMDGNIERVTTRLFDIDTPLPESKPILYQHVTAMTPPHRPGDFAQAMMDLGATVCVPGNPKCVLCPLVTACRGRDRAETLPRKLPKKAKPTRKGTAFWITRQDGSVLLRRRAETGLLGGMMEIPSTDWTEQESTDFGETGLPALPTDFLKVGDIRHTFTHFHLELQVFITKAPDDWAVDDKVPEDCIWCLPDALDGRALPTLMRKIVKTALMAA